MLNHNPEFIYTKSVFVYGKKNSTAGIEKPEEETVRLEFFPEGGNFINGVINTIAFKATNKKGFPVSVAGRVVNKMNEEVTTFSSYHYGMGMFEVTPSATEIYYVLLDGETGTKKYSLPESTDKGIALTIIPHPQGIFLRYIKKIR